MAEETISIWKIPYKIDKSRCVKKPETLCTNCVLEGKIYCTYGRESTTGPLRGRWGSSPTLTFREHLL